MPTISEIAKQAGVSVGTVDRVIHDRGRVSDETRKRVLRIISEMNYKPNVIARNLSLKKTTSFAVLMPLPEQDGRYWELPASGMNRALDEIKMYNVEAEYYFYDKYSENSFEAACNKALENIKNLDGIVIAPVLSHASEKFIQSLPVQLPFVFIDSYIPCQSCLSYVGQESYQSGVLAAKLMQLKLSSGRVAAFRVLPEDYHIEDRVRGFRSVLEHSGTLDLTVYDADRQQDSLVFHDMTVQIYKDIPDVAGLFVPSACTHQVAEYLCEVGRQFDTVLIGYDLVEENRRHLKSGAIDFLISQRPAMQGYEGIYALFRHVILKEPVADKLTVPMDILTVDNVDYYQG